MDHQNPKMLEEIIQQTYTLNFDHGEANSYGYYKLFPEDDYKKTRNSILRRILQDYHFRRRLISTAILYLNYITFAWLFCIVGPSLPDLQIIANVDLKTSSWLFVCYALGYMVGCVLHGALHDKIHNLILLSVYSVLSGIFCITTPWCSIFSLMLVVRFLAGISSGCTDSAAHAEVFAIWDQEARTFSQLLAFVYGIGGMLTSLCVKYFLENDQQRYPKVYDHDDCFNNSMTLSPPSFENFNTSNVRTIGNHTVSCYLNLISKPETRIQWAYLIAGCFSILSAIPLFTDYLMKKTSAVVCESFEEIRKLKDKDIRTDRPRSILAVTIILLSFAYSIQSGFVNSFQGYLNSFVVEELGWLKSDGALATSFFFTCFSVGTVLCIFISVLFTTKTMIIVGIASSAAICIGFTVSALLEYSPGIWVCVVGLGLSHSPMWPSIFTYIQESITPVTGKLAAILSFSSGLGILINPIAVGYAMDSLSTMFFCYILLAEWIFMSLLYIVVFGLYRERKRYDNV